MNKLIATTALISTMMLTGLGHAHETPEIKLGGKLDFMYGYRTQSKDYRYKTPGDENSSRFKERAFVTDSNIDVNVDGKLDLGLKYGGFVRLHTDSSPATNDEESFLDKAMIYMQNDNIGRLELGIFPGTAAMLEMDTTNFARATYGVEGFWSKWINNKTKRFPTFDVVGHQFIIAPNLPSNASGHYYSDAPKINFYTRPVEGLILGITYIPDLDDTGSINSMAPKNSGPQDKERENNPPTMRDIISVGAQYKFNIQDIDFKTGVVGEVGKAKANGNTKLIRDLKAYEVGLAGTYQGVTLLGSYGSWGKTGTYKDKFQGTKQGSAYWTLGLAQTIDKFAYSITYMNSKKAGGVEAIASHAAGKMSPKGEPMHVNKTPYFEASDTSYNKFQNISVGADYKLTEGLLSYAEVSRFTFKEANIKSKNSGIVLLTGMRLNF